MLLFAKKKLFVGIFEAEFKFVIIIRNYATNNRSSIPIIKNLSPHVYRAND